MRRGCACCWGLTCCSRHVTTSVWPPVAASMSGVRPGCVRTSSISTTMGCSAPRKRCSGASAAPEKPAAPALASEGTQAMVFHTWSTSASTTCTWPLAAAACQTVCLSGRQRLRSSFGEGRTMASTAAASPSLHARCSR